MPRFYFDVHDSRGFYRDDVGDELESSDDARQQCQGLLSDIASDDLPDVDLYRITCDVRDESGRVGYRGILIFKGIRNPTSDCDNLLGGLENSN